MIGAFNQALMITTFVFVMMLVIEYLNVLTSGQWQQKLVGNRWGQYLLAGFLGVLPGCLGPFVVVTMYSHRILTLGAVVAAMIATSGDEAYVMLAMIPRQAFYLMSILLIIGILAGAMTDLICRRREPLEWEAGHELEIHTPEVCQCFPRGQILQQWRKVSPFRALLTVGLLIVAIAVAGGQLGPPSWNWVRVTLLFVILLATFITATVPDHFLEQHLWHHVTRQHVPRIFLWTFGTLLVMHLLLEYLHLESVIRESTWIVLLAASLVGLIPESGPHLVFVTLYAKGVIPGSILLASSIVQDGHGMLPMLAHSTRIFLTVKVINLVVGFILGAILLASGW